MSILTAIIAFLTSLPKILSLAETLIKLYEDGVKKNESKLLEKADDDVTKFVRRVQASHGVRIATTSGEQKVDAAPANNKCDCGRAGLCDRSSANCKQAGAQGKEPVSFPYDSAK